MVVLPSVALPPLLRCRHSWMHVCRSLSSPAPKGRPERTPFLSSQVSLGSPASSGLRWRHLQNAKTISGMLGLSGECQGWGAGGRLWSGWVEQGQLLTFWLEPGHHGSCPSCKHDSSHLRFLVAPSLPEDQCHSSGCSSGLDNPTKLRATRP